MRITSFGHAAMLLECAGRRILVDPWLTHRLDRFWERWPGRPAGLDAVLDEGVDLVVFSHHHYDHHHFPSLVGLLDSTDVDFDELPSRAEETAFLWPRSEGVPRFTASGLGHQAIGWTLRRLGFERSTGIRPGESVELDGVRIQTLPSRVPFPEMCLVVEADGVTVVIGGDAMLSPGIVDWFAGPPRRAVDLAFVPTHSVAPPGVLTERRGVTHAEEVRAKSTENVRRWTAAVDAAVTVPSSFGWRVREDDGFGWCNSTIFPLTPTEALGVLRADGREGLLWGPGQVLDVEPGGVVRLHDGLAEGGYDFATLHDVVTLRPETRVPAFDPATDRVGRQRDTTAELLDLLVTELVGTDFWYRAVETGSLHHLRIDTDAGAEDFLIDPGRSRVSPAGPHDRAESSTRIAAATLQSMADAELLFGSSYALWTSSSNLLSAVFHHPKWYQRHVERYLGSPA